MTAPEKFPERLLAAGLSVLAPARCTLCGMDCPGRADLCRACAAGLAANDPACPRCALPLESPGHPCGQCQLQAPLFSRAVVPLLYQEPLSMLLHRFKFGRVARLARPLAALMAAPVLRALEQEPAPDLLVPMPLHWWRRWRRGFNQAEMLARELSRLMQSTGTAQPAGLSLPLDCRSCTRPRPTRPQVGLGRRERDTNLLTAFRCKPLAGAPRVAIIDDIVTTGASANALAGVLLEAGASRVELWACARTP